MIALLTNLVLFAAVLFAGSFLVIYAALSLIGIVASRFDVPLPAGVYGIAVDQPERDRVELTDDEEAAFEALRSNWNKA